jgi:hypothetical protein
MSSQDIYYLRFFYYEFIHTRRVLNYHSGIYNIKIYNIGAYQLEYESYVVDRFLSFKWNKATSTVH